MSYSLLDRAADRSDARDRDASGKPDRRQASGDAPPDALDRLDRLLGAELVARLNDAARARRDVDAEEADTSFEAHLASLEARCALGAICEDIAERLAERRRELGSRAGDIDV